MIYEMINSGSHGNSNALYKCMNSKGSYYMKAAFCHQANEILEKEYKGYNWFFEKIMEKPCPVKLTKNKFYELAVPEFVGKTFPANAKLLDNENIIERFITFYKEKWPMDGNFSIHGDLALCNIIYNDDSIFIVDWEHFHQSEMENYGLDIINMLFISLVFQDIKYGSISNKSKDFIKKCCKSLFEDVSQEWAIINKPFQHTSEYMRKNRDRYGPKVDVEEKFRIATFPDRDLKDLDLAVTSI